MYLYLAAHNTCAEPVVYPELVEGKHKKNLFLCKKEKRLSNTTSFW
jgi:hypothetical protein